MKTALKAICLILFVTGCQQMPYKPYARKVKMKPRQGGIVALNLDHNDQDRAHAEKIMSGTCYGKGFDIMEEGEVVIGTTTTSTETSQAGSKGTKVGSLWGVGIMSGAKDPSKNTNSTTMQKKEWQITYKCARVAKKKRSRKKA